MSLHRFIFPTVLVTKEGKLTFFSYEKHFAKFVEMTKFLQFILYFH